jgi:hypothetical protein
VAIRVGLGLPPKAARTEGPPCEGILTLVVVTLGVALVVGTAGATPHGTAAIRVPAAGTFTPALGADTVSFTGTLSVERFVEVDEQLALEGCWPPTPLGCSSR